MTARIVIGGTSSGAGKTSISIALCRAFARRGLKVQPFKVGPDFLDPTYLTLAAGRLCFNLDGWMTGRDYVLSLFRKASQNADIAIIEGVMGLFDGASADDSQGSAAEISDWLDAKVLLVADAGGIARSFAAVVHGFSSFDPELRFAGVVANRVGSAAHGQWLSRALESAPHELPLLVGAIPRGELPKLPSRHLGLESAGSEFLTSGTLDQLSRAAEEYLDLDLLLETARTSSSPISKSPKKTREKIGSIRLGIARDQAFHFYYRDVLDALSERGCELIDFSPISDHKLPDGLDGLIFGGGYPELHAEKLSSNSSMRDAVRDFAASGRPIYGECGGLMYLCSELETAEVSYPMVGLFESRTRMLDRLKRLSYVEVTLTRDSLWGKAGETFRGHEFHYSELVSDPSEAACCSKAYEVRRRRGGSPEFEGFQLEAGNVLASYCHLHFGPKPDALDHFVRRCLEARDRTGRLK